MTSSRRNAVAFASGLLFAGGLGLSGMTKPAKVQAFLDVTGDWDPSLMLVMVGAIGVYAVAVAVARRRAAPLYATRFAWPTLSVIDARLVGGAALFGVGWGLMGFCPGPAIVSVASLAPVTVAFFFTLAITLLAMRRLLGGPDRKGESEASVRSAH